MKRIAIFPGCFEDWENRVGRIILGSQISKPLSSSSAAKSRFCDFVTSLTGSGDEAVFSWLHCYNTCIEEIPEIAFAFQG